MQPFDILIRSIRSYWMLILAIYWISLEILFQHPVVGRGYTCHILQFRSMVRLCQSIEILEPGLALMHGSP